MTDRVLFSSVPDDTEDPTHINLHEPPYWCGLFAEQGLFFVGEEKPVFLTNYALFFQRKSMSASVELYERKLQKDAEQFLNLSLDLDELQGELDELQEKKKFWTRI